LLTLLGHIERDPGIHDVRQAAYMLATVMWETTSPVTVREQARNHKGQALHDKKGRPVMVSRRKWVVTMEPVAEVGRGKGRRYHLPVKVKQLPDGSVRITEQDGDQFRIVPGGAITGTSAHALMGSKDGGQVSKAYDADDGVEQAYFGRGYVQLTWWSNYAASGIAIGRGLELLHDPELVRTSEVAYALMSHGMRTGQGFANGHKFSDYFTGQQTRYREARQMVNGTDHAQDIAALAQSFEAVLLASLPRAVAAAHSTAKAR
jgi:hypothetical protein